MDQSKVLSQFMKILSHTKQVSINMSLVPNLVDMLLKLSDGELKMVSNSGNAQTLGMKIGVTEVSSEFSEDLTIVELKDKWLQELQMYDFIIK